MVIDYSTYLGYKCPSCNDFSTKRLTVFDLPGKKHLKIQCKCGESHIEIHPKGTQYIIKVPCFICSHVHEFSISKKKLWTSNIFAYNCAASNMDICAFGSEKLLKKWQNEFFAILNYIMENDFDY